MHYGLCENGEYEKRQQVSFALWEPETLIA